MLLKFISCLLTDEASCLKNTLDSAELRLNKIRTDTSAPGIGNHYSLPNVAIFPILRETTSLKVERSTRETPAPLKLMRGSPEYLYGIYLGEDSPFFSCVSKPAKQRKLRLPKAVQSV
uniref:Uncharacterized protein n=1 Tax=Ciona intestinalis TaxID=7719 RepID=H2Y0F8_CIOIN